MAAASTDIPLASRAGFLPASESQQGLWYLSQTEAGSRAYHLPLALRLRGPLDVPAFRRSVESLVVRHEVLRTRFFTSRGALYQDVLPDAEHLTLDVCDLDADAARPDMLAERMTKEIERPFRLDRDPPVRAHLFRLAPEEHVFLFVLHHMISDGWSIAVIRRELAVLYEAFLRGEASPLSPLPLQYADYSAWQRKLLEGPALLRLNAYWRDKLAQAPPHLDLPTDRKHPPRQDFTGGFVEVALDEAAVSAVEALSRKHRTTKFATIMAAWAVVLSRLSGQERIVIGTPSANRSHRQLSTLVGFFVNTLPICIDLPAGLNGGDLLREVRSAIFEAQDHQGLPFDQIARLVQPSREPARTPVFQAMFVWGGESGKEPEMPGLGVQVLNPGKPVAKFDLTLSLREVGGKLVGGLIYAAAVFDAATVRRQATYLRNMLVAMAADDRGPIGAIDFMPPEERRGLLQGQNPTAEPAKSSACVHTLFEAQVKRRPDAVALTSQTDSLTYEQLNAKANQLARYLRRLGVGPGALVAVCVERSPDLVIALLSVLKAGAAFVPIDPKLPPRRIAMMLEESAPAVVLTRHGLEALRLDLALPGPPVSLDLVADACRWADESTSDIDLHESNASACDLAYVIFTSGSTGKPKGVMIEHRNASNLYRWYMESYLTQYDSVLVVSSISFDLTLKNIFATLASGARVVLAPPTVTMGRDLVQLIRRRRVTLLNCAPSQIYDAVEQETTPPESLRHIILGGEQIKPDKIRPWLDKPHLTFVNSYGPTEIADVAIDGRIEAQDEGIAPIGRPISNTQVYILSPELDPVPLGSIGELYIGGMGVGRGYLNGQDLTAQRFIADRFSPTGGRLYRTGDLCRFRPDGRIEFVGRSDHQVKIRGHRVEVAEIEAQMERCPAVRRAAVALKARQDEDAFLVGYYVAETAEDLGPELQSRLRRTLPDHMIPAAFVRLPEMPLTASGKLDRKELPEPDERHFNRSRFEPPIGPIEMELAALWSGLLEGRRAGRQDEFFALGGHSLLAARMAVQIHERFGIDLGLEAILERKPLFQLAQDIGAVVATGTALSDHGPTTSATVLRAGEDPPIFLLHPVGGGLDCYGGFLRAFDRGRALYGLHAYAHDIGPQATLDEICARYVEDIAAARPSGPLHIAGYSFGGLLASEIARRFHAANRPIGLLALIDPPLGLAGRSPQKKPPEEEVREFAKVIFGRELADQPAPGGSVGSYLERLGKALGWRGADWLGADSALQQMFRIYQRHRRIMAETSVGPNHLPCLLHLASARRTGEWLSRIATRWPSAMVREIDADHQTIMEAPAIDRVASDIADYLGQVEQSAQALMKPEPIRIS